MSMEQMEGHGKGGVGARLQVLEGLGSGFRAFSV